jgi:hypothetical protein
MINIIAVSLMSLWSFALRETTMDKLMPPLVAQVRKKVKAFRDSGYAGVK